MRPHIILIGMDDNPAPCFTAEVREYIRRGRIFSGGMRHYEIVKHLLPAGCQWIPVTVPLANVLAQYRKAWQKQAEEETPLVVFASGDPLFYGFGNTLLREMPEAELRIFPAFNSLQLLAHRIPMRYDDMRIVSLTGRPWQELDCALIERAPKIGILTDRQHTPATIAARLTEYGYHGYEMYVGTHLGNPQEERICRLSLEEAMQRKFEHPNCLLLCAVGEFSVRPFGIPDEAFEHLDGRSRMITKAPIRLLSLQALELRRHRVFWDIGFCTGSVSIEARIQFPHLKVCSFEIRPECEQLMETNARRHGAPGIEISIGDFLRTDLSAFPVPDAVFIGGHGGKLCDILERIETVLQPGGCVVFNAVSEDSRLLFEEGAQRSGFRLLPSLHLTVNDFNPITIMKAIL